MKTYTVSFIALSFFFFSSSCSEENDSPTNSSSSNGTSWSFEIELAGKTHRAKGVYPGDFTLGAVSNGCSGMQSTGNYTISLGLNDKTASTYISGEPLDIGLTVYAGELGNNNKGSMIIGMFDNNVSNYTYMKNFALQKGFLYPGVYGFVADSACSFDKGFDVRFQISGIKLTELGSPPSYSNGTLIPTYSQIKGEYQGTLYFAGKCNPTNPDEISYCIPVPISIKFTAIRVQ